jgi:hypothetical protein
MTERVADAKRARSEANAQQKLQQQQQQQQQQTVSETVALLATEARYLLAHHSDAEVAAVLIAHSATVSAAGSSTAQPPGLAIVALRAPTVEHIKKCTTALHQLLKRVLEPAQPAQQMPTAATATVGKAVGQLVPSSGASRPLQRRSSKSVSSSSGSSAVKHAATVTNSHSSSAQQQQQQQSHSSAPPAQTPSLPLLSTDVTRDPHIDGIVEAQRGIAAPHLVAAVRAVLEKYKARLTESVSLTKVAIVSPSSKGNFDCMQELRALFEQQPMQGPHHSSGASPIITSVTVGTTVGTAVGAGRGPGSRGESHAAHSSDARSVISSGSSSTGRRAAAASTSSHGSNAQYRNVQQRQQQQPRSVVRVVTVGEPIALTLLDASSGGATTPLAEAIRGVLSDYGATLAAADESNMVILTAPDEQCSLACIGALQTLFEQRVQGLLSTAAEARHLV